MARKERQCYTFPVLITGASATLASGSATIPLWSANTIYTHSFDMNDGEDWAISYSWAAGAIASLNATTIFEQGWREPLVQGSADPIFVSATPTTITSGPLATWQHATLNHFEGLRYGRFKVSGVLLNTGSSLCILVHKTMEG